MIAAGPMTNLEMARRRMHNLRMTDPLAEGAGQVATWLVASQAQDYAGALWALGLRLQHATASAVEQAFNEGALLRTHLLRPTWHFVAPADIRWLLTLTGPRVNALNATYYRKMELDAKTLTRSADVLARTLAGGQQLTRAELRSALENARLATAEERMAYMLMHAELAGIVCSGARRGKQFTYALLEERVRAVSSLTRDDALVELAARYFRSRGPATVHDFARWSGLTVADARRGLEAVQSDLLHETVGNATWWFPASSPADQPAEPVVHLLSIYDEYVSSYKDRSALGSEEHGQALRALGNALAYIIVVEGRIVGTWKRAMGKNGVTIETNLLTRLKPAQKHVLTQTVQAYSAFWQTPVVLA